MNLETMHDTLMETADDLRDVKIVVNALPTLNAPESVRAAIQNLLNSALDQTRLILMKSAICVANSLKEECSE